MLAQSLIVTSALIILLLGLAHLYYTFVGSKLRPRDAAVETAMAQSHPGITTQTTLWRAWVGFNASHSLGAMLFGLIYAYLALYQAQLLFTSAFLMALGLVFLAAYLVLGFLGPAQRDRTGQRVLPDRMAGQRSLLSGGRAPAMRRLCP